MKDRREKKYRKIRHGIEDMSRIDRMIIVKLGHKGKMGGFKGEERGRVSNTLRGQGLWSNCAKGTHTQKKPWMDLDLTLRGNITI